MRKKASAFSTVILIIMLSLVVLAVAPRFFGINIYAVTESDVESRYSKSDALYTVSVGFEDIMPTDYILFVKDENLTVLAQKVYDVDRANYCFITKGESEQASESNTVMYENVLGVVKFSVPVLGYVFSFTNKTEGKIIVIAVIAIFAALSIFLGKGKEEKVSKQENE